jgi:transcription elongation factor GreA-like protein
MRNYFSDMPQKELINLLLQACCALRYQRKPNTEAQLLELLNSPPIERDTQLVESLLSEGWEYIHATAKYYSQAQELEEEGQNNHYALWVEVLRRCDLHPNKRLCTVLSAERKDIILLLVDRIFGDELQEYLQTHEPEINSYRASNKVSQD